MSRTLKIKLTKTTMFIIFLLILVMVKAIAVNAEERPALTIDAKSSILLEPYTGKILYENNADQRLAPASVTKVMTMLLIYDALENGAIKWEDTVTISEHAASMGGSQIFLEPFEQQTVEALVKSIVIASANDAAIAMAEFTSGSEEIFVDLMNKRAVELGCNNTQFKNACGLDEDGHYTSARDMALIAQEMIKKHPEVFEFTKIWQETITHKTKRGEEAFGLTNTNKLIKQYDGATGLKTGSTGKALYCLVGTAEKNEMSLISVVLGSPTPVIRFQEVMKMFDYGYANYKATAGMESGTEVGIIKIEKGKTRETAVVVKEKVSALVAKNSSGELENVIRIEENINAPVREGDKVGEIIYAFDGAEVGRSDIIVNENIEKANLGDVFKELTNIWFE